jgi:hypothetical protein
MAIKPLTAAQKSVLKSLAFVFVVTEAEQNIKDLKGLKKSAMKSNPLAAQAERAFNKAVKQIYAEYTEAAKSHGT